MVLIRDSWKVLDDGITAIKRTDKSVFKSKGSGIPVDIRPFFDLQTMEPLGHRNITLHFRNIEYAAYLERKGPKPSGKQTQIHWYADLKKILDGMFPGVVETKFFPDMIFHKIDKDNYKIEFVNSMVETGNLFVEDESLETVVEGYVEGKRIQYYTTRYERNRHNREKAVELHGLRCQACGFSFEETYGGLGSGFIEVHHINRNSGRVSNSSFWLGEQREVA